MLRITLPACRCTGNHAIRTLPYIPATSNNISTFAGTGTSGSCGEDGPVSTTPLTSPDGLAVDSGSFFVYFSEPSCHRVRVITLSTLLISTVVGTGDAFYSGDGSLGVVTSLVTPRGLCVDSSLNLYIAGMSSRMSCRSA